MVDWCNFLLFFLNFLHIQIWFKLIYFQVIYILFHLEDRVKLELQFSLKWNLLVFFCFYQLLIFFSNYFAKLIVFTIEIAIFGLQLYNFVFHIIEAYRPLFAVLEVKLKITSANLDNFEVRSKLSFMLTFSLKISSM